MAKAQRIRINQPFWPVTYASGILALAVFAFLLSLYLRSGEWQYLGLSGLAVMTALAHVAGWQLARTLDRPDVGIWLIASIQIISTALVPLFLADYWLIGLLLLAVIPLEIGVADRLSRMPASIVLSLLGAAAMLAIDLQGLPDRLTILSELPYAIPLTGLFLILHFSGLAFLLWRIRLWAGSRFYTRLHLSTQLSLVFTAISGAAVVLVVGVLIFQIRAYQINQVGQNFQTLAEINAERIGNHIEQQIDSLIALGRREVAFQEALAEANAGYPVARADVLRILEEREQRWQASAENSDFILQYRNNPVTVELSKFRGVDLLHNNMLLTDRYGGLVAAQGEKPARYSYHIEAWWQAAWNNSQGGVYIGNLAIDLESKIASVFMAVSVLNPQTNQIVGVLGSTYRLSSIQRDISGPKTQSAAEVHLLSPVGIMIAGPDERAIGEPAWPGLLATGILETQSAAHQMLGTDRQGREAVLAYAPLDTTTGFNTEPIRSLGIRLAVIDTQAKALAGVTQSTKIATLVGLWVMIFVVLAAIATARMATRPIKALTTVAAGISAGNLEQSASPRGPVEMVTLAEAFNTLTARLRSLINNLQDQVAHRTAQLEARAEQLATLNRITQAVAAVRDLQPALEIVAREMVQLLNARQSGIALLNPDQAELKVVADYSLDPAEPSINGALLPVNGDRITAEVIATGRSIVVDQEQSGSQVDRLHPLLKPGGRQCLMIVPLMARGELIGTIGLTSGEPGRSFSPSEVELAETIAGQIAGAIDNARLFKEMEQAKEAAEAANRAKSDFLANISHELRTPLTSVLGFAKIIQKRLQERILPFVKDEGPKTRRSIDQVERDMNIIIAEGERLTTLINDVLDLAKIEAGKIEWQMERLEISEVIDRAIAATSALFEQKGLPLIKDVAGGLPRIAGDRDRLIQVCINLLSNAVKFTHVGSVTCRARHNGKEILISMIDTGIGITEADQPRVFEKFTQVGDTLTDKPQGSGLGLPISKEIVEHHGGRMWVESALGQGSTFTFTIPVTEPRGVSNQGGKSLTHTRP